MSWSPNRQAAVALVAVLAALVAALVLQDGRSDAATRSLVRLNGVGYSPSGPKSASLMTTRNVAGSSFAVVDERGAIVMGGRVPSRGPHWSSRWPHVYALDLTRLTTPGAYRIEVAGITSPPFRVAPPDALYRGLAGDTLSFFQTQRDGPDVVPGALDRMPAHLSDRNARVYATPRYRGTTLVGGLHPTGRRVNVAGGWFDAGDYLKFTETASFSDVLMLLTLRDFSAGVPDPAALEREARFGTDWLLRMWDRHRGVLYEQVGIGDGNGGTIRGDHDLWRLPQRDDRYRAPSLRYLARRPVFAANRPGATISPNLAGRTAAAFGLCAQVWLQSDPAYAHKCLLAGQTLYGKAATRWHGRLATTFPRAYYSQSDWRSDMELAAIELYLGTLNLDAPDLPHRDPYDYVEPAATWANAYMSARNAGQDAFNLYDVAAIAHYDLYRVMVATGNTRNLETNASDVLADLSDQLRYGQRFAAGDPFGLANISYNFDPVPHALGYAVEARLYDVLAGRSTFERFAGNQLAWMLGRNAWGSSFVVGAGPTFPRCLAHQVANLSGSLTGQEPLLRGAVVDGPTDASNLRDLGAPSGHRACPARGDPYRSLDSPSFRYVDDVRSSATSEPADDYTALGLLAFAQAAAAPAHAPPVALRSK